MSFLSPTGGGVAGYQNCGTVAKVNVCVCVWAPSYVARQSSASHHCCHRLLLPPPPPPHSAAPPPGVAMWVSVYSHVRQGSHLRPCVCVCACVWVVCEGLAHTTDMALKGSLGSQACFEAAPSPYCHWFSWFHVHLLTSSFHLFDGVLSLPYS